MSDAPRSSPTGPTASLRDLTPPDWWDAFFREDYLLMYAGDLTPERSAREAACAIRALRLRRRELVLDLCCGFGRHIGLLRKHGLRVVGLDRSLTHLRLARRRSRSRRAHGLARGDARMLPLASGFDAVLCLYTSFGYFSDEDNLRQISEMVRVLRPGGRLLIDNQNPLLAHCRLPPDKPFGGAAGARFAEQFEYDTVSRRVFSRKQVRSPRGDRDYCFALRLYAREDLSAMLSERGMTTTGVYGDHDLRPYAPDSPRLILTACKPAAG